MENAAETNCTLQFGSCVRNVVVNGGKGVGAKAKSDDAGLHTALEKQKNAEERARKSEARAIASEAAASESARELA